MLHEVRTPLLEEARRSPSLLSDLAGLEQYIAESYDSRSFVELLQNADDAGASRFVIQRSDGFLIVANDGRAFTKSDFESLCRSAASSKSRGTSIGYRGIGFKSVVGFARTIHLISGDLAATFSSERTAKDIPQATRVPLIRIPHPLEESDRSKFSAALDRILSNGLVTGFVFDDILAGGIENEFSEFDPTSLLFLRHVRHVELLTKTETVFNVRIDILDTQTRMMQITTHKGSSQWLVIDQDGVAIAFSREADRVIKLNEREAVVHAFLPTLDSTGLAVKIHGDISTDPSRTRVVLDERTASGLDNIAALVVRLLKEGLFGEKIQDAAGMIAALVPLSDPRIAGFQRRSFKTELFAALQRCAKGQFDNLRCRPAWLNAVDFETLSRSTNTQVVPRNLESIEGLQGFLCFLGAKEATFEELSPSLREASVSVSGAAEFVAYLSQRHATKQIDVKQVETDWHLWPVKGKMMSFTEAEVIGDPLDQEFADLVVEKSNSGMDARRLIAAMSDQATASALLPEASVPMPDQQVAREPTAGDVSQNRIQVQPMSLKRWRGAEQQVFNLLIAQGWTVEDVSRQNIGYDIAGRMPDGEEAFIEVKSTDHAGQAFTLTSNEEAVARQKGIKYHLAIVRQTDKFLEVAFIRDPTRHLQLTRQCRQWVWECAGYTYSPQRFPLE